MASRRIVDYHAALSLEDQKICEALRAEIDAALPSAESKIWHAHPVWFLSGNPIVGYSKLKASVQLMFWSGQSFETAGLQPTGKFKAAELRFTDAGDINSRLLREWLAEAARIQWDYKNIVKRKGRLERLDIK